MNPALLLCIIYLAFISLGLPDGVFGVAWPSMRVSLGLPLEAMGIYTTVLLCMSALSSISSGKLLARFSTGTVTAASCIMTGLALAGYTLSTHPAWLLLCTIPLGLGQGGVDSALNLHVANHYSARHMNWLHCFWGVGASIGPVVMTMALAYAGGWRVGYGVLAGAQMFLAVVLVWSLVARLWPKDSKPGSSTETIRIEGPLFSAFDQSLAILLFFLYVGFEFTVGIWLYSLLVESRSLPITFAGLCIAVFYASIMTGRFLAGLVVHRFGNQRLITGGLLVALAGALGVWLFSTPAVVMACTAAMGLGSAPVYPGFMHETPRRFKAAVTQRLMGRQIGAACLGGSIISGGMGLLLARYSLDLLPPALALIAVAILVGNRVLYVRATPGSA